MKTVQTIGLKKRSIPLSFLNSTLLITTLLSTQVHCADVTALLIDQEQNAKSGFQLAGYASFDYAAPKEGDSGFNGVKFAPIFHYGYADILQFEGELEFLVGADGETEVELEYAAANLFLNNYMTLTVGKFMSPIGQFVQNFHPSWINKLPTAPVGYGHGGAAPNSNVGIALRGGLPKVGFRHNYVLYLSNAPTLVEDGDLETGGTTESNGVSPTIGGRYAIDPIAGMEIGVSGAVGKVYDSFESNRTNSTFTRDYSIVSADITYNIAGFDFRAEYIEQNVQEEITLNSEGGKYMATYAQLAYQFDPLHLEPVVRYAYNKDPEKKRTEFTMGLNYLFANNIVAKVAYALADRTEIESGDISNEDTFLAQLAFGF